VATPQSSDAYLAVTLLKRHRGFVSIGVGLIALVMTIAMYVVLRQRSQSADSTAAAASPLEVMTAAFQAARHRVQDDVGQ
jgi:hypothetical protein